MKEYKDERLEELAFNINPMAGDEHTMGFVDGFRAAERELKSDLLNPVSKLFDDKINEINHQLNVSGFEGYHEFRKAQDEVRSLEVAKRVLNVC